MQLNLHTTYSNRLLNNIRQHECCFLLLYFCSKNVTLLSKSLEWLASDNGIYFLLILGISNSRPNLFCNCFWGSYLVHSIERLIYGLLLQETQHWNLEWNFVPKGKTFEFTVLAVLYVCTQNNFVWFVGLQDKTSKFSCINTNVSSCSFLGLLTMAKFNLYHLRFYQRWLWRILSSGTYRRAVV